MTAAHSQGDTGEHNLLPPQGVTQGNGIVLAQTRTQEIQEIRAQWANQENHASTSQWAGQSDQIEAIQEILNGNPVSGNNQGSNTMSTPIVIPSQVASLYSAETPIEIPMHMPNLTTSSLSMLSHESESTTESLIEAIGNNTFVMQPGRITIPHYQQQQQRRLSERRPRGSSTTSNDDTSNCVFGTKINGDHELQESEPFSQVFINRTKERMQKKKHKAQDNVSGSGYWV